MQQANNSFYLAISKSNCYETVENPLARGLKGNFTCTILNRCFVSIKGVNAQMRMLQFGSHPTDNYAHA